MKLRLLNEDTGMVARLRARLYGLADEGDAAVVWWNPMQQRAFISVGDWASPRRWVEAINGLVDRCNIETTHEGGPGLGMHESGQGTWVVVRDYRRIKDNCGMTPERRLEVGADKPVIEGVVAAARGNIVNIINDLAARAARSAQVIIGGDRKLAALLNFTEPQIEFADEGDQPAVVLLRLGGRTPETLSITVFGDGGGEIKLEISERLGRLLGLPRHAAVSSLAEVNERLSEIIAVIRRKVGAAGHVNSTDQSQTGGARQQ